MQRHLSGGRCGTVDKLKDQEGHVMSRAGTGTRQRQMKTKQSSAFSIKTIRAGVCRSPQNGDAGRGLRRESEEKKHSDV